MSPVVVLALRTGGTREAQVLERLRRVEFVRIFSEFRSSQGFDFLKKYKILTH